MTPIVKKFIEDQIDLIESENWQELFILWSDHYAIPSSTTEDCLQLNDFFETLRAAGLGNVKDNTEQDRKTIIVQYINEYIDELIYLADEYVSMVGCFNSLRSRLCLGLLELKQLFIDTCESRGLKPTGSTKSQFNLK